MHRQMTKKGQANMRDLKLRFLMSPADRLREGILWPLVRLDPIAWVLRIMPPDVKWKLLSEPRRIFMALIYKHFGKSGFTIQDAKILWIETKVLFDQRHRILDLAFSRRLAKLMFPSPKWNTTVNSHGLTAIRKELLPREENGYVP